MNELPGDSIGQILMELMLYLVEKGVLTSDDIKEITKRALDNFKKKIEDSRS